MKQLCIKTCQLRIKDQITLVPCGRVLDYPDEHPCLRRVSTKAMDFATAGADELMETEWTVWQVNERLKKVYGSGMTGTAGKTKKELVEQVLDFRFRNAPLET